MNRLSPSTFLDKKWNGVLIGDYLKPGSIDDNGDQVPSGGKIDGGDTCQRTAMYHIGYKLSNTRKQSRFLRTFRKKCPTANKDSLDTSAMLLSKNDYVSFSRHPDPSYWYSESNRMSRDQAYPMVAALGLFGIRDILLKFFVNHLFRFLLFTTNTRRNGSTNLNHGEMFRSDAKPLKWYHKLILKYKIPIIPVPGGYRNYNWKLPDITFFSFWALYIRGFRIKWLYPLLYVLDLEFVVNAVIKRYFSTTNDVVNHIVESVYSQEVMPTKFVTWTNKYINSYEDLRVRMENYFLGERSPWFIAEFYKPLMKNIMGK